MTRIFPEIKTSSLGLTPGPCLEKAALHHSNTRVHTLGSLEYIKFVSVTWLLRYLAL